MKERSIARDKNNFAEADEIKRELNEILDSIPDKDKFVGSGCLWVCYVGINELRERAEQGDADALKELAARYYDGISFMDDQPLGVPQDFKEAAKWYRLTAEKGDVLAQYMLGWIYFRGKDVTQDFEEAAKWFRLTAEQEKDIYRSFTTSAQYLLGWMHTKGLGVNQDKKEAAKWYRLAGNKGHGVQYIIAGIYQYGLGLGIAQDYKEAVKWYRIFLEKGGDVDSDLEVTLTSDVWGITVMTLHRDMLLPNAQYNLGYFYEVGRGGVKQDYKKAIKWYRLATEQENYEAMRELGWMYMKGRGVTQNLDVGMMYLKIAGHYMTGVDIRSGWEEREYPTREDFSFPDTSDEVEKLITECYKKNYKDCD